MDNKENLEAMKKQLVMYDLRKKILNERKQKLEENEIIKEYNEIIKRLETLNNNIKNIDNEYYNLLQSTCDHPLWYFLYNDSDSYENRQEWVCECVKCGIQKKENSRHFKNLIIKSGCMGFGEKSEYSMDEIKNTLTNLEKLEFDETEITKILQRKYNK